MSGMGFLRRKKASGQTLQKPGTVGKTLKRKEQRKKKTEQAVT